MTASSGTGYQPHCSAIDEFRAADALAGTTALIGVPGKNNNAGAACVVTVPRRFIPASPGGWTRLSIQEVPASWFVPGAPIRAASPEIATA